MLHCLVLHCLVLLSLANQWVTPSAYLKVSKLVPLFPRRTRYALESLANWSQISPHPCRQFQSIREHSSKSNLCRDIHQRRIYRPFSSLGTSVNIPPRSGILHLLPSMLVTACTMQSTFELLRQTNERDSNSFLNSSRFRWQTEEAKYNQTQLHHSYLLHINTCEPFC